MISDADKTQNALKTKQLKRGKICSRSKTPKGGKNML